MLSLIYIKLFNIVETKRKKTGLVLGLFVSNLGYIHLHHNISYPSVKKNKM